MAESTLTRIRWTITRKAAVVLELLRSGDAIELARRHGLSQVQVLLWLDRGLSRLIESHRLGAIGQQGKSWSVAEVSKDGFSGFFYSSLGKTARHVDNASSSIIVRGPTIKRRYI